MQVGDGGTRRRRGGETGEVGKALEGIRARGVHGVVEEERLGRREVECCCCGPGWRVERLIDEDGQAVLRETEGQICTNIS